MISADLELKNILNKEIFTLDNSGKKIDVPIYASGEQPSFGVDEDFVSIYFAGTPRYYDTAKTFQYGSLVVDIYSKLNTDNTIKRNRSDKIIEQISTIVKKKVSNGHFFDLAPNEEVEPARAYISIGYSTTSITINWHTI